MKRLWPVGVLTERFRYLTPSSRASQDFDTQFSCLSIFDTEPANFFISEDSVYFVSFFPHFTPTHT